MISSKNKVWSGDLKQKPAVLHYGVAHWTELFRLSLALDRNFSVLSHPGTYLKCKSEFLSKTKDKTKLLSSLQKFMQISFKTEVFL